MKKDSLENILHSIKNVTENKELSKNHESNFLKKLNQKKDFDFLLFELKNTIKPVELSENHEEKFRKKLEKSKEKEKFFIQSYHWFVAASIILLVGILFSVFSLNSNKQIEFANKIKHKSFQKNTSSAIKIVKIPDVNEAKQSVVIETKKVHSKKSKIKKNISDVEILAKHSFIKKENPAHNLKIKSNKNLNFNNDDLKYLEADYERLKELYSKNENDNVLRAMNRNIQLRKDIVNRKLAVI